MIRISKLTDYGIVLLTYFTRGQGDDAPVYSARELSAEARLPLPVVSKVLKMLTTQGVLESQRGKRGGYRLSRRPQEISVAQIIDALEGPIAITECTESDGLCKFEVLCPLRANWQIINHAVRAALANVPLSAMHGPTQGRAPARPLQVLEATR
jgi:FeS assembly SUF system regulator